MILCCGEALIDMLPRETTLGEKGFAPYAGGAIFNTAIALGRLGIRRAFFTGLADDMMGEILRDTLKASNVDFSLCAITPRPSTVAFVKLVNGQATYAFYDEGTAGRMITNRRSACPQRRLRSTSISVLSALSRAPAERPTRRSSTANAISASFRWTPTFAWASSRTRKPTWRASSAWRPSPIS